MSESASVSMGIASRYATAIFELAKEGKALASLEADVETLKAALAESADLRDVIHSPVYSRNDQASAIRAVAEKAGLSDIVKNTLGLMAAKRRLFVLPQLLTSLSRLIADEKGEVEAEVTSAKPLTETQQKRLIDTLKKNVGQDVKITASVDEGLIGGLIVKVGSRMIDTSIRSKLAALQNTMKEVG